MTLIKDCRRERRRTGSWKALSTPGVWSIKVSFGSQLGFELKASSRPTRIPNYKDGLSDLGKEDDDNDLTLVSTLEFAEAIENDGDYRAAAEHFCQVAEILLRRSKSIAAYRFLVRARGLDPTNTVVAELFAQYYSEGKKVKRPPVVVDCSIHFPGSGGSAD